MLDLSQNMNPFAPQIARVAARHLTSLDHYPDPTRGQEALAEVLDVDADRVILTNGGSEAIDMVARQSGGLPLSEPEFALHPRGQSGPRWRSNPHSPTGRLATCDERAEVWDEAYFGLATGQWTARRGGLVVGSLTKVFACPGLRLGYVLLEQDTDRAALMRHQPHWSVNGLALACLPDLLAQADLPGWAKRLRRARGDLVTVLRTHNLQVSAADAPWVLVEGGDLRSRLAPHAVLVRDCASFGMPGTFRIAVPDERGLSRLAQALER